MDSVEADVVKAILKRYKDLPEGQKFLVAVAGVPGAGKTTVAAHLRDRINLSEGEDVAVMLPMDGFHLTRDQLSKMPNPEEAFRRRGAPWTFDPDGLYAKLRLIRDKGTAKWPGFDHHIKDPAEDQYEVLPNPMHKIIIVEGIYLLMDLPEGRWGRIGDIFDFRVFINIDVDTAMNRIATRHVQSGIEPDMDAARARCEGNDKPNGLLLTEKSKGRWDMLVESIETPHA